MYKAKIMIDYIMNNLSLPVKWIKTRIASYWTRCEIGQTP